MGSKKKNKNYDYFDDLDQLHTKETLKFAKLLRKNTAISDKFIDMFFTKKFRIDDDLRFHIKDSDVADFLGIQLTTLRARLNSKTRQNPYLEGVDFVKQNYNDSVSYRLTYTTFEKLAMQSKSRRSEEVRGYFIELRQMIFDNCDLITRALKN